MEHLEDRNALKKALLPTSTAADASRLSQDSLIKVFLGVPSLQSELLNHLIDKLPELFSEDEYVSYSKSFVFF